MFSTKKTHSSASPTTRQCSTIFVPLKVSLSGISKLEFIGIQISSGILLSPCVPSHLFCIGDDQALLVAKKRDLQSLSLDFSWGRCHSHLCQRLNIPGAGLLGLPAADSRQDHNLLLVLKREGCSLCPSGRFCTKFLLAVAFPSGSVRNKSKQGREECFSKLKYPVIFCAILQLLIANNILVWIFN